MIFLSNFTKNNDDEWEVGYINYEPNTLNKSTEELSATGVFVEQMPNAQHSIGKTPVLCYNSLTSVLFYKYIDRELTTEEKLSQLEAENANITYVLMMEGII